MILKLSKPTQVNGSEITELNLDLETLKGKDLMELETSFRKLYRGEYVPVVNIDSRYQVLVAGRVCGVHPDDLGELYAPDFAAMCSEVQSFLLSGG
jgi:tail assembly chaperone E/41/14-like protein